MNWSFIYNTTGECESVCLFDLNSFHFVLFPLPFLLLELCCGCGCCLGCSATVFRDAWPDSFKCANSFDRDSNVSPHVLHSLTIGWVGFEVGFSSAAASEPEE